MKQPRALVIAGPNGAGKTTFALEFLRAEGSCLTFINADLIAAGLSPLQPEATALKAMRLMAEQIHACIAAQQDFAVESTLAGRTYVGVIRDCHAVGYRVKIVYLWVSSVELAIDRVCLRVAEGGHDVPEDVIRRRFSQGWANFNELYRPLADAWQIYDCSGPTPVLVKEGERE